MSKHIYKKSGPPTFAPPQIGHHYIDITNKIAYISVGTASPSDWVPWVLTDVPQIKAGVLHVSDFTGSPKKASVVFITPITVSYAVNINGVDPRVWSAENLASSGFTINSNANAVLTGDVFWEVQEDGEFH